MSQVFFQELTIPTPDYNLGIGGGTHGQNTGRMIEGIEKVLLQEMPDVVLVYGDTDSTLAGALAAAKLQVPAAHVEAGLRSYNRGMPEEINRVVTDHVAEVLFAPTKKAVENLLREGLSHSKIHEVGDVMYDAALLYSDVAEEKSGVMERLGLDSKKFILATVHRAENTDDSKNLIQIIDALGRIGEEIPVVFPIHPRTRERLNAIGLTADERVSQVTTIDPVSYLDMVMLEKHAALIVTDSGGVQKEAFFYRVPCVTLRTETEWVELLEMGWNRLVPPHASDMVELIRGAMGTEGTAGNPYGNGHAAESIVSILAKMVHVS